MRYLPDEAEAPLAHWLSIGFDFLVFLGIIGLLSIILLLCRGHVTTKWEITALMHAFVSQDVLGIKM